MTGPPGRLVEVLARCGPLALLVLGVLMARFTWATWPDPLIDFGRELYLAWQLAEGKALYADAAHINGPLSPYLNALWFRLFGTGLATLVAVNLVVLSAITLLLHHLLAAASGRAAALAACSSFLLAFAFSRYSETGSYNFVAPYSHELVHGIVLGLLGLACAAAFSRAGSWLWALLGGLFTGLVFLTKVEVFVASAAASITGLSLAIPTRPAPERRSAALAYGVGAFAPALVAWFLLTTRMPPAEAVRGILGGWATLTTDVASMRFYRAGMGIDDPAAGLTRLALWAVGYAVLLAPGLLAAHLLPAGSQLGRWVGATLFVATAGVLVAFSGELLWLQALRPLPLFVLALLAWQAGQLWVSRRRGPPSPAAILRVSLLVYAAVMLGKIVLSARLYHYGFALAMPATLLVIVAGTSWIPELLDRRGACGAAFRGSVLGLLAAGVLAHVLLTRQALAGVTLPIGSGPDRFLADRDRGEVIVGALDALASRPPGSLAVFPEGVMLNYLARRPSSVREYSFTPFDLLRVPEDDLLRELESRPPDLVLLVHRETPEYGARWFGKDYSRELGAWIRSEFRPVRRIGDPPLAPGSRFGILMLVGKAGDRSAPPR